VKKIGDCWECIAIYGLIMGVGRNFLFFRVSFNEVAEFVTDSAGNGRDTGGQIRRGPHKGLWKSGGDALHTRGRDARDTGGGCLIGR